MVEDKQMYCLVGDHSSRDRRRAEVQCLTQVEQPEWKKTIIFAPQDICNNNKVKYQEQQHKLDMRADR